MCEVKNGSSWYSDSLLKFDAFAMKKSWKNPKITIYEIKVNRQDFVRDQKYLKYMEYCHEFYFACPPDLIKIEEIPDRAGLLYVRENSTRTIRKAKYVDQQIPVDLFVYIIMSRLETDRYPFHGDKIEYYKDFVEQKKSLRDLGYSVSGRIRNLAQQHLDDQKELETLHTIKELFKKYGVNTYWVQGELEKILAGQTIGFDQQRNILIKLNSTINELTTLKNDLEKTKESVNVTN